MFAPPRPLQLSALVLLLVSVPSFSQSVQKGVRASASATAPKTWEVNPHLDPITDKPILEAKLVTPAQSNGRLGTFLTTASCNLQTGLVSFQVVYKSISENGVGFLHKPRVPVRVRIDRFEASNLFLAGDYANEVKFSFASEFKQTVESALERMTSVGETKDLYSAEVIKFEFTLDNGDTPILEIHPQDPSFVNFASQCPGGSADQTRANNAVQQTLAAAQDGFRYTNHIPQQERQFTGTVEEFAKAFPDIMKRVVSDSFRYKTNWEKEADYVIAAARTCDEAISQVAQRIKSLGALQGTKYEACSPSINVSQRLNQNVNLQAQRGMVMTVTLPPGQNSTGQFILQVVFTRLPSDVITSAQSTMLPDRRYVVNDYRIFTATINPTPRSDKSLPTTTAGSPTPPQILAPPAYRTLDPASFKQFDGSNGFSRGIDASVVSGVVLDLNLIHLQPTVLNDPKFLNYFIRLNNCGNLEIDAQMNNEFVYPKMAAFYKDKAAEILKAVPSEIGGLSFRKAVTLGQYDLARMAFPLTTELRLDHFDIARQFSCVSTQFFGGLPTYQIRFNPVNFREMPMDELKAREFVAGSPGSRGVVLKFDLDIVEQQPTTLNGKVVFLGKIRTVTALRTDYPIPLAVLSSAGDTDRVVSPTGSPVGPPSNALPNSPEVSAHADAYGRSFLQYIRSCNAGIGRACQLAGYCYESGRGVDKDIEMARQYYQKGCDINDPGSCTHVKMLK